MAMKSRVAAMGRGVLRFMAIVRTTSIAYAILNGASIRIIIWKIVLRVF
jgi:hypothetical protein